MTQFNELVTEPIDWVPGTQPSLTSSFTLMQVTEPTGLFYRNSLPDQQRDNNGDPCYLKNWLQRCTSLPVWPITENGWLQRESADSTTRDRKKAVFHISLPLLRSSPIHPVLPAPVSFYRTVEPPRTS